MYKILVIDDEDDIREGVRYALEAEGYWVICAGNGREALEMLRGESEPCLILLDLIMPILSGWQFREAQLGDPALARCPCVVLTATDSLEDAAIDADEILQKPINVDRLLDVVARYCTPADFAEAEPTSRWRPDGAVAAALALDDSGEAA